MNISQYFRFFNTIETKGYKWDSTLDKVVPTGIEKYSENIDIHWIQHTDNCTNSTRRKIMEAMQLMPEPLISQVHWEIFASWRMEMNHYKR